MLVFIVYLVSLAECSRMSTDVPGFQWVFFSFLLHHSILAKLAASSIRVKTLASVTENIDMKIAIKLTFT